VPLALVLSETNRTDMKKLEDLLEARLLPVPEGVAPHLCLDRGDDYPACRETAAARGYTPHIPPKASAARPRPPPGHPDRHPPRRWVAAVGHSWFNRFRRLLIRWRGRRPTTWPSPTWPPASSSIARCAMPDYFLDRL
jgi:putative transposase